MEINGKVYRNLEGQVGYLTDKYDDLQDQINDVRAHLTHYVEVDQLPTGDDIDPSAVYLLGPMGTAPDQYYEEWVYVQKADESWVWEKLGDTDSLDLSGYLPIQDGVTTLPQVYGKTEAGEQAMVNMDINATALTIPFRDANGRTKVAAPSADGDAANKKYCDDSFVEKNTGESYYPKVYVKREDGTQGMIDASTGASTQTAGFVVLRASGGHISLPGSPTEGWQAANKTYVDSNFLAKQTGATTYPQAYVKAADGGQVLANISTGDSGGHIVQRTSGGQIFVPTTPTDNAHAASKAYVDAAVGQLLYLHDIEIIVTVDATNKLYIKAFLINGSATAITSIDSSTFKRMDVQYGCFGVDVATGTPCAVTKKPDSFVYGNFTDPRPSYLYQYISGGTLQAYTTTNSMAVTVTDTVISF